MSYELELKTGQFEKTELIPHGGKFQNCIIDLYEGAPYEGSQQRARKLSKIPAVAISIISKIPYISISIKLGPILGPTTAIGNYIGLTGLEYWAITGMANDIFEPNTKAEIELYKEKISRKKKIARNVIFISVASLIALFTQLPTTFAAYEYNPEPYKLLAALTLLIGGAVIPLRSLQLSKEQLRFNMYKNAKIQERMHVLIKKMHDNFIKRKIGEKIIFINNCNKIRDSSSSTEINANSYVLSMLQEHIQISVTKTKKISGKFFNYTGMGIGIALAGIFEYALGEYTFDRSKEHLGDSAVLAGTLSTLTVATTAYLFGGGIIKTSKRIFNLFGNLIQGNEIRNLSWQLRPKLSFTLTSIGLFIDLCALGLPYVIWGDFYHENNVKHHLFQKTMCVSQFLVLFTATLDIIDELVVSSIAKGTEEEKQIFKINEEFQKLAKLVKKSPTNEFICYLASLDSSIKTDLLTRLEITAEQLTQCVEPKVIDTIQNA